MDKDSNRFVAVNLTDAEWRALRTVTPDPSGWMKAQIRRLLDESGVTVSDEKEPADAEWGALTSPGL